MPVNVGFSYHDLHITTKEHGRTAICDLPYGLEVWCNRVSGWAFGTKHKVVASEYGDDDSWLVLDVKGYVIVDSRIPREPTNDR